MLEIKTYVYNPDDKRELGIDINEHIYEIRENIILEESCFIWNLYLRNATMENQSQIKVIVADYNGGAVSRDEALNLMGNIVDNF